MNPFDQVQSSSLLAAETTAKRTRKTRLEEKLLAEFLLQKPTKTISIFKI
jgi:hypothetical protein